MDKLIVTRLASLERRVALLEGKPDPGGPCTNPKCRGGFEDAANYSQDPSTKCETCNGTGWESPSGVAVLVRVPEFIMNYGQDASADRGESRVDLQAVVAEYLRQPVRRITESV